MALVEKKISYIFSSDPANGAQVVSNDGSTFNVTLNYPISLPHSTKYATLELHSASIWYVTPNISADLKNNIFSYSDGVTLYSFTIDDGLYNFTQLVEAITLKSATQLPAPVKTFTQLFNFFPDDPTQRTAIQFVDATAYISWVPNGLSTIFGFNVGTITGPQPVNTVVFGDTQAEFNVVNQYYINTNLVNTGIPLNSKMSNVLSVVYIDVPPGSQINYQPFIPQIIDASELIGAKRTNFRFWLTDQKGRYVDTVGEVWSFVCTLRYWILM